MTPRRPLPSLLCVLAAFFGCGGTETRPSPGTSATASGGSDTAVGGASTAELVQTGGGETRTGSGGVVSTGGHSAGGATTAGGLSAGGTTNQAGRSASGGATAAGGSAQAGASSSGVQTRGGSSAIGGTNATGAARGTGGAVSSGGNAATGGSKAVGGAPATGGSQSIGGNVASGGTRSSGGALASGGANALGGSASGGSGKKCEAHSASAQFNNPLNSSQGSDPFLFYFDCNYYLTATTWNSQLTVKKSPTLAGLKTATATVVWDGSKDDASRCCNFWAPEIHQLEGPNGRRWYFYYSGGPGPNGGDTGNQRNHVLESAGSDPMGPYTYKGHVHDSNDTWAIDASVVTIDGILYFLFSAWEGDNQNIYIAGMSNPWTMKGSRVRLSQPSYDWEKRLANVNEGPVALQYGGKTFVAYSASACWGPSYSIGLLTLTGSNPLVAGSWTKSAVPVFSSANSVYGPAHNGFFRSPDGTEDWIVYHANSSSEGVCDTRRTTRAQKFTWNSDGSPNFGLPVATATALPVPSGE